MKIKIFFACILATFFFTCQQAGNQEQTNNTNQEQSNKSSGTTENNATDINELILNKGMEITGQLQQLLASNLQQAIADSGVSHALQFCSLQAYPFTDSVAELNGVKIKRASSKARNMKNRPEFDEFKIIANYREAMAEGSSPEPIVEESEQLFSYYAPIMMFAPLCLKCHGILETDIAPQDFIVINMIYPQDQATGFSLNELRGIWRVDFDKSQFAF